MRSLTEHTDIDSLCILQERFPTVPETFGTAFDDDNVHGWVFDLASSGKMGVLDFGGLSISFSSLFICVSCACTLAYSLSLFGVFSARWPCIDFGVMYCLSGMDFFLPAKMKGTGDGLIAGAFISFHYGFLSILLFLG